MEEILTKFIDFPESINQAIVTAAKKLIIAGPRADFGCLSHGSAKLKSDLSLDRFYLNGGLNVHYVHVVKRPEGKHCKPVGYTAC